MHFVLSEVCGFSHRESLNAAELQKTSVSATDGLLIAWKMNVLS
jgi:hypothetical protein